MDRDVAIAQLEALVKVPGALKIITNVHRCQKAMHPRLKGFSAKKCDAFKPDVRHPGHFVVHDVIRIEGPNAQGQYTAFSAEGDYCIGQPEALLKRLQEANG